MTEKNTPYKFRQDFFDLVEELRVRDNIQILETFHKVVPPHFQSAINSFNEVLKEEKRKFYTLDRISKLMLDKALFKKNYGRSRVVAVNIYPFSFWDLTTNHALYDNLVMLDKKQNLLKQVGGIPMKPLRDIVFQVTLHNMPPSFSTKKIEISKNMKAVKMTDKELEFMQPILEKIRSQILD